MAPQLPHPRRRGWLRSKKLSTFLSALGALGGAVYMLYKAMWPADMSTVNKATDMLTKIDPAVAASLKSTLSEQQSIAFWAAFAGLLCVVATQGHAFYVAWHEDADAADRSDPYHLRAPLLLLDEVVRKRRNLGRTGDDLKAFRATLHKPVKSQHVQVVPYVGWRDEGMKDGGVGRSWSNRCGLVGCVIRKNGENRGAPLIADMPDEVQTLEQYWQALRDSWGYTLEEARAHAPMRMSSIAVPIMDGNKEGEAKVIGVLYCDSSKRKFFDDEIAELCVLAASAIADHVRLAA